MTNIPARTLSDGLNDLMMRGLLHCVLFNTRPMLSRLQISLQDGQYGLLYVISCPIIDPHCHNEGRPVKEGRRWEKEQGLD
jgi:hypothetical protein